MQGFSLKETGSRTSLNPRLCFMDFTYLIHSFSPFYVKLYCLQDENGDLGIKVLIKHHIGFIIHSVADILC